jgi:SPP1 family phage portal protein
MFDIDANRKILQGSFTQFQTQWRVYQKMYFYYMGITDMSHDLLWAMDGNYSDAMFMDFTDTEGGEYSFINNRTHRKINTNFIKKFIKEEVSYSVGNDITYTSKTGNGDTVKAIQNATWHWDETADSNLCKNMLIYSTAFELYYIDNQERFCSKIISPRHAVTYADEFGNIIYFMHIYRKMYDAQMYIDIYTDSEIIHLNETLVEIAPRQVHPFGQVPVGIAQVSEEVWLDSLYQDIKTLQDSYEANLSDISNEITEFRNSYLCFFNCQVPDEDLPKIRKDGIMNFKGQGEAKWLVKQINDNFIQNTLNTLEDKMYQISGHINHNTKISSNTSSLALRAKLIGLEEKCKLNNKSLHNCIKTRIQCLFNYLNSLKGSNIYDWTNLLITFTPNVPQDDLQMANVVNLLGNRLSTQTALSLFSFVTDPQREMEQSMKEQEESTVGSNLLDQARAMSNYNNNNNNNTDTEDTNNDSNDGDGDSNDGEE